MKRRTFISLMSVMAAAGVLTLSGCSNSSSSTAASGTAASAAPAAGDQLSNIQSSGKLIVALEGAWQPWSFHDESDTLVGYDVEVSRAIAEKLGVEPEYVESDWDSLFAGLDAGRYDIVCNGVEVTDERAKTYDFTDEDVIFTYNADGTGKKTVAGKVEYTLTYSYDGEHLYTTAAYPDTGKVQLRNDLCTATADTLTVFSYDENATVTLVRVKE